MALFAQMALLVELVWWLPAALWAVVFTSDMLLTFWGSRLYRQLDGRFVRFDAYELTPFWKTTIERGRRLTPRFGAALLLLTALVAALGWLAPMSGELGEHALAFGLGALFLTQAAVHLRHARNIFLFRALLRGDSGVEGLVRYPAPLLYRMSAMELAAFAVLYALVAALDGSFFWLGGAGATLGLALRHGAYARAASRRAAAKTGGDLTTAG